MPSPTTEIILSPAPELQPASHFTPTPKAAKRFLEFFIAQIKWCNKKGIAQLADVQTFHVAAFAKEL